MKLPEDYGIPEFVRHQLEYLKTVQGTRGLVGLKSVLMKSNRSQTGVNKVTKLSYLRKSGMLYSKSLIPMPIPSTNYRSMLENCP